MLRFALVIRNYVSLQEALSDKRRHSLIFYLSKFQKQIAFFDFVHRSSGDLNKRLVEKKVEHDIRETINFLKTSEFDIDFLRHDEYEIQVKRAEVQIKASRCKRIRKELTKINDLLNDQSQKTRRIS